MIAYDVYILKVLDNHISYNIIYIYFDPQFSHKQMIGPLRF
jgi:hypothetical protein